MIRRMLALLAIAATILGGVTLAASAEPGRGQHAATVSSKRATSVRPIIFVHGFAGSGAQFDTPARRFASNGYPAAFVNVQEYDSTFANDTVAQLYTRLDQQIASLLTKSKADRVDLVGHSLGTTMSQGYLNSSPQRAARVAHYVNLDGATATALPGNVPTLAIWGEGSTARAITGGTNVYQSDQSHTQTVTSAESFKQMYTFFTGKAPRTTRIVPQRRIQLSGRALLFPQNAPVTGARLDVFQVRHNTGARMTRRPMRTFQLTGDGSFGPFRARGDANYEFAITYGNGQQIHHLYFEPFLRTDRLVRLLSNRPGEGVSNQIEANAQTSSVIVNRYKEWWGDQGNGSDILTINGQSVLNAANTPRQKLVIGIFVYDHGLDGVTDLAQPIPAFANVPFLTGIDKNIAAGKRLAILSLASFPRGGKGRADVVNVRNWPGDQHRISVQFNDFQQ